MLHKSFIERLAYALLHKSTRETLWWRLKQQMVLALFDPELEDLCRLVDKRNKTEAERLLKFLRDQGKYSLYLEPALIRSGSMLNWLLGAD